MLKFADYIIILCHKCQQSIHLSDQKNIAWKNTMYVNAVF